MSRASFAGFFLLSLVGHAAARCFMDAVWSQQDVVVEKGITFGSAHNNATGEPQALLLDSYSPPKSDPRDKRPAMVLIHGGAFVSGSRSSDGEPDLAYALARRGFFVVSIEYRLTGYYWGAGSGCHKSSKKKSPPCENTPQTVIDAQDDGKAAVRFLRKMAKEWRLDADRIGIAGDSAGAITVDWMGYVASGDGKSGNPGYSSAVSAVVPISGALRYQFWCDGLRSGEPYGCQLGADGSGWEHIDDIVGGKQPTLCQVHGTDDTIVPYSNALAIKTRADKVGLSNSLISIQGGGHVPMKELLGSQFDELTTCLVSGMDLTHAECPKPALAIAIV